MLNPVIFLSRAILVALVATFTVVVAFAIANLFALEHIINHMTIGILFAAGLAYAGAKWGHQQRRKSTTPLTLEIRLFLIQFALFLFILSGVQFYFGTLEFLGREFSVMGVLIPLAVAMWVVYWCMQNILSIDDKQAEMTGTKRTELMGLSLGLLFAPFLLLIPGFALSEVFGFDPQIIFSVFQYAPIMSAALPAAFSIRRLVTYQSGSDDV